MTFMKFNYEHYKAHWAAAGTKTKQGMFDVTVFPNGLYCFPIRKFLGINGKLDEHKYLNKKFINRENEVKIMDSVNVHWYKGGYYYFATLKDKNNSHVCVMFENINSKEDIILDAISEFHENYEIL